MDKKKPPRPNKKPEPGLNQKERFIAYAKMLETDESGERFNEAIKKVVKPKEKT